MPSLLKPRGCSPRTPVTFCTAKKSPKSRQGGFAPSGHPHSSWAGGARECLRCLDSALPLNFCALQWQDWQLSILRLPALHVEVPAGLRSRCAMRTRQEICPVRTMPVARKSLKRIVLLGGEPNEEDQRAREWWRRFDWHRPREEIGERRQTGRSVNKKPP